ncbi:MAG: hypothetical protein HYY13_11740 [Nitrospirae bacterium]|nr:hypothetical protein [Nitrospirota bacterium]
MIRYSRYPFFLMIASILAMSVGYHPKSAISVPSKSVPFAATSIIKDGWVLEVRRTALDLIAEQLEESLLDEDFRDLIEESLVDGGPCPGAPAGEVTASLLEGTCGWANVEWACAYDLNADRHFLYFDSTSDPSTDPSKSPTLDQNACAAGATSCPPELTLELLPDAHGTDQDSDPDNDHPDEAHLDAHVVLYDVVFEVKVRAGVLFICGNCDAQPQFATFPITMVLDPNKVDANNINARADDAVITLDIPKVTVDPQGDMTICNRDVSWDGCVASSLNPVLDNALGTTMRNTLSGPFPMDMNALFSSQPAFACPTYAGTARGDWCAHGVQDDVECPHYGYCADRCTYDPETATCSEGAACNPLTPPSGPGDCKPDPDCKPDGLPDLRLPAYDAAIGKTPPTEYGLMACTTPSTGGLTDVGVYPHLTVVTGPGERMTMHSDFACEVREPELNMTPGRLTAQASLCCCGQPGCGTCSGNPPSNTPCCPALGSCQPRPGAQPDYDGDGAPDGMMFACSTSQDVLAQSADTLLQSGLFSIELDDRGLSLAKQPPVALPPAVADLLSVDRFAGLLPPLDDIADPDTSVSLRLQPFGDADPSTPEICLSIGGAPGPELQEKGCSAVTAADRDVVFSFRRFHTDVWVQQGGTPVKALGLVTSLEGALEFDAEDVWDTDPSTPRVFADAEAFLESNCNAASAGGPCLKLALGPLDLQVEEVLYFDPLDTDCPSFDPADPDCYRLDQAQLAEAVPDVFLALAGGLLDFWMELPLRLPGFGIESVFFGPNRYAPDLDGNGRGDYLTCAGRFDSGGMDLDMILDRLQGSSRNPCLASELDALRDRLASAPRRNTTAQTPVGGPDTFLVDPLTGQASYALDLDAQKSVLAGFVPSGSRIEVEGVGSDAAGYHYRVDRGFWRTSSGPTIRLPFLLEGSHVLEVAAVDAGGRRDPSPARLRFVVDSVPPAIRVRGLDEDPAGFVARGLSVSIYISDAGGPQPSQASHYRLDDADPVAFPEKVTLDLSGLSPDTEHTLEIEAEDAAGHRRTIERRFRIDSPRSSADPAGWGCAASEH